MATPVIIARSPALHRFTVPPILRGLLWAAVGFMVGGEITLLLKRAPLWPITADEPAIVIGCVVALIGWLLGVGAWEGWVRGWFGLPLNLDEGEGRARYFRFNTDHKVVGLQYLVTAAVTLLLAGLIAMGMRYELMTPDLDFFPTRGDYETWMGVHGTLMIFAVAVVAIVGGFGNYFVPLMIGAEDMAFPELNALSYWFVPAGVVAILMSPLLGGFGTGWTGYAPLSAVTRRGILLYYFGVYCLGMSSFLGALNFLTTIIYMRAPGLTWARLPIFVWAMLITSILNLVWVPVVSVDMVMGLLDRIVPTSFFNAQGLPILWQDLFWLFGHPEVYIIILPAWGLLLEMMPPLVRKPIFGYRWLVSGFLGVMALSSMVWVHHMFVTVSDVRLIPFMTTTELISIPTGMVYLSALGTLWKGKVQLNTPTLFMLGSLFNFLIGGLSGVFLADVLSDFFVHDTFFVVGHFHYTIMGGMVFALLAGLYYWFPKFSGRMYNEALGKVNFWWTFLAFNATFFQMFDVGYRGMNRRIAVYLPYLATENRWISLAAFVLGASFVLPVVNFAYSWVRGPVAERNPWRARTLEWQVPSPPPRENFPAVPRVVADFYGYGEAGPEPVVQPVSVPSTGPGMST